MRNKLIAIVAVILAAGLGWYLASPSLAMSGLKEAALSGSKEELEEKIDFPSVRESLKSQMRARLATELAKEDENPFAALGSMLAMGLVDGMVDGLVTPEAMAALIKAGKLKRGETEQVSPESDGADWKIERNGIDEFVASPDGIEEPGPSLVFERDGLSRKLVEIRIPDEDNSGD